MSADFSNMLRMMGLLGDEGFVDALTGAEKLIDDVEETLDRVEKIEGDAEEALREANAALTAVDARLAKFDETIRLLEAKIEAGFSVAFLFFALNQYLAGELLLAAGLAVMGLLGASSLVVTILTMPQVKRLREMGQYAWAKRRGFTDGDDDTRDGGQGGARSGGSDSDPGNAPGTGGSGRTASGRIDATQVIEADESTAEVRNPRWETPRSTDRRTTRSRREK